MYTPFHNSYHMLVHMAYTMCLTSESPSWNCWAIRGLKIAPVQLQFGRYSSRLLNVTPGRMAAGNKHLIAVAQNCSIVRQPLEIGMTLQGQLWEEVYCFPASLHLSSGSATGLESTQIWEEPRKTSAENYTQYERTNFNGGTIQSMKREVRVRKCCMESQVTTKGKERKQTLVRDKSDGVYIYLLSLWIF